MQQSTGHLRRTTTVLHLFTGVVCVQLVSLVVACQLTALDIISIAAFGVLFIWAMVWIARGITVGKRFAAAIVILGFVGMSMVAGVALSVATGGYKRISFVAFMHLIYFTTWLLSVASVLRSWRVMLSRVRDGKDE